MSPTGRSLQPGRRALPVHARAAATSQLEHLRLGRHRGVARRGHGQGTVRGPVLHGCLQAGAVEQAVDQAGGERVTATHRERMEILDRVGGGDSFASGLVYGLLDGAGLQTAVEYGAAHGALAMTTPGDTSMATKAEVLKLAGGGSARVDR